MANVSYKSINNKQIEETVEIKKIITIDMVERDIDRLTVEIAQFQEKLDKLEELKKQFK